PGVRLRGSPGRAKNGPSKPVIVIVAVAGPVIVAVHVHGNPPVDVIEEGQGSMSLVSMATTRTKSSIPWTYCSSSTRPATFMTSRCDADSIAEPLAMV